MPTDLSMANSRRRRLTLVEMVLKTLATEIRLMSTMKP